MKLFKSSGHMFLATFLLIVLIISCTKKDSSSPQSSNPIVTEIGSPVGDPTSESIGSSGGTVTSADGLLTVTIPADALSSNTEISIQPIDNKAPLGLGSGYRLQPEGTTFSKPIQIAFHYTSEMLQELPADFLWIVTQAGDGSWNAMLKSAVDTNAKNVIIQTTHFSDWALGRFIDLTLDPATAILQKGQSVQLKLSGFIRDQTVPDDAELAPLIPLTSTDDGLQPLTPVPPIESRFVSFKVKNWSLNGVDAPVTNNSGSLNASGNGATYTAPTQKPTVNPVAVTADLETTNKEGAKGKYLITSNITVFTDYYVSLKIDGVPYDYTQYGFTTTTPPDPNNFSLVVCGITDGRFDLMASFIGTSANTKNIIELSFDNPSVSTRSLIGSNNNGNDVLTFEPLQGNPSYELNYTQRTPASNNTCDRSSNCGSASVTLSTFTPLTPGSGSFSEVRGTFSGTIYEDKPNYDNDCISSDKHTIEGEFWLMMSN